MSRNDNKPQASGERDPAYATAGRLKLKIDYGSLSGLTVLSDQSSMVQIYTPGGPRLLKVTPDGEADSRFGKDGLVDLKFTFPGNPTGAAWIFKLVEIQDGGVAKLLLLMSITVSDRTIFVVARLLENGELDLTFGSDEGYKGYEIYAQFPTSSIPLPAEDARSASSGNDINANFMGKFGAAVNVEEGKILVSYNVAGTVNNVWLFRLHSDGLLDKEFGVDSRLQLKHPKGQVRIHSLTPAGGVGQFLAAGWCRGASEENRAGIVGRFFNDGRLDETFGDQQANFQGFYETPGLPEPETLSSYLKEVFVNKLTYDITAIGYQDFGNGAASAALAVKLSENGVFDPSFNSGVVLKIENDQGLRFADSASVDSSDGALYVAGKRSGLQRRSASVQLDPTFGVGGYAIYPDVLDIVELALQVDGKLLMLSQNASAFEYSLDRLLV